MATEADPTQPKPLREATTTSAPRAQQRTQEGPTVAQVLKHWFHDFFWKLLGLDPMSEAFKQGGAATMKAGAIVRLCGIVAAACIITWMLRGCIDKSDLSELQRSNRSQNDSLQTANVNVQKLQSDVLDLTRKLNDANSDMMRLEQAITATNAHFAQLRISNENLASEMTKMKSTIQTLSNLSMVDIRKRFDWFFFMGYQLFKETRYQEAHEYFVQGAQEEYKQRLTEISPLSKDPPLSNQKDAHMIYDFAAMLMTNVSSTNEQSTFTNNVLRWLRTTTNNTTKYSLGVIRGALENTSHVLPPNLRPFIFTTIDEIDSVWTPNAKVK